jgi:AcrR family transcriptional regulator
MSTDGKGKGAPRADANTEGANTEGAPRADANTQAAPRADANTQAAPRSRRERPAKPALSREAIVAAGLEIAQREGLDALSLRRLAQALDTGPASLYVYVANRDELWDLLFDAAAATVETEPTDPRRWREQLQALGARVVHMMAIEYPGLARIALARIPMGENSMRIAESMLSLLKAGGVSDQAAAYAVDLITTYVYAIALEQSLYAALYDDPDHQMREVANLAEHFAKLPADRYPTMVALRDAMTLGDGEERFSLGLDVIINGLLATPTEGRLTRRPWDDVA